VARPPYAGSQFKTLEHVATVLAAMVKIN